MSRSTKKTPGFTDCRPGSKRRGFYKRLANKRIRRMEDVENGGFHKRATGELSYDICDHKSLCFTKDQMNRMIDIYGEHKHRIRMK